MALDGLKRFYLVGGTNLALKYGHRKSVDLDLFSIEPFDNKTVIACLEKEFKNLIIDNPTRVGIFAHIENIKVDFIQHHFFKQVDKSITEDSIRFFGDKDIMAMKVFAILQRAQKKDFWDVHELLKHYTIQDFIDAYLKKYPNNYSLITIPYALTYFDDAEQSETPVSLKKQTWEKIKSSIRKKVSDYLK